jgi:4-amino-4-deoxy-L-arabinose transferase-like glycosyltransferase
LRNKFNNNNLIAWFHSRLTRKNVIFFGFFLITLFFCFWKLGEPKLESWDEGTNANIIYNSVNTNNPFELKIFDSNFLEKPPLWYYATFCSVKIFGFNTFALRFVSAISGFLLIMLVFKICNDKFGFSSGIISGLILICSRQLFFSNLGIFATHNIRSADLDILQVLFIMLNFYYLWKQENNKNIIFAGIFSGLAILTKGPVGLLPIILVFVYKLKYKRLKILKSIGLLSLPIMLINATWFLYMVFKFGSEFLTQYFGYHILERSVLSIEGNTRSIIFYFQILFNPRFFFSGILLILGLYEIYKNKLTKDFFYFSLYWGILGLLIFITIIPTKLSWYILPIYPLASITIAHLFDSDEIKINAKLFSIFNFQFYTRRCLSVCRSILPYYFSLFTLYFFYLFLLPRNTDLNLSIGKPFFIIVLVILLFTLIKLKSYQLFIIINIITILPIGVLNILRPQKSDLDSLIHSNYLFNQQTEYIYVKEIDRSDWYYLTKNNISYLEAGEIKSNMNIVANRRTASLLQKSCNCIEIKYSQGEYYLIDLK